MILNFGVNHLRKEKKCVFILKGKLIPDYPLNYAFLREMNFLLSSHRNDKFFSMGAIGSEIGQGHTMHKKKCFLCEGKREVFIAFTI